MNKTMVLNRPFTGSACESDTDSRSAIQELLALDINDARTKPPDRTINDLPPEVLLKVSQKYFVLYGSIPHFYGQLVYKTLDCKGRRPSKRIVNIIDVLSYFLP